MTLPFIPSTERRLSLLSSFSRIEFVLLCLLAITLPVLEAPKNLFCFLYLLTWITRLLMTGSTGLKKNKFDIIFAVFLGGNILASAGAYLKGYEISEITDILRYGLVGWMLLHTSLSNRKIFILLLLLLASTFVGTALGYWELLTAKSKYLELHSVGHVNHTSIYLLMIIGGLLPFLIQNNWPRWKRFITAVCVLLLLAALMETRSRATIIGFIFILIFMFGVSLYHHKKLAILTLAITIGFGIYSAWKIPPVFNEFITKAHAYNTELSPREKIWNVAIAAWKKEPVFGYGYGNYHSINVKKLRQLYGETSIDFADKSQYLYFKHAHNRYLHSLTEGGIIGFSSLLFFILGSGYMLWRKRNMLSRPGRELTYWLIGFNTLSTIAIVGLFNTTLHHEHALLGMFLLVLSYKTLAPQTEDLNQP